MTEPWLAASLLRRAIGHSPLAESILGDLHEEHARLAAGGRALAGRRADLWYWRESMRLGARYAARRAARRVVRPRVPALPAAHGDSLMRTLGFNAGMPSAAWSASRGRPRSSSQRSRSASAPTRRSAMIDTLLRGRSRSQPGSDRDDRGDRAGRSMARARASRRPTSSTGSGRRTSSSTSPRSSGGRESRRRGRAERVAGFVSSDFFLRAGSRGRRSAGALRPTRKPRRHRRSC